MEIIASDLGRTGVRRSRGARFICVLSLYGENSKRKNSILTVKMDTYFAKQILPTVNCQAN